MPDAEGSPVDVSVLVPVASEASGLAELHAQGARELEGLGLRFEILFLVRSSSREALEAARKVREADSGRVRVVEFAHALGNAALLGAGVERARAPILFTLPAPLETRAEAIGALYGALQEGSDLVIASRKRGERGRAARLQSELFNRLLSFISGTDFHDIASSTRVARREVFEEIPIYGDFHRYLPLLALRTGFRVQEVPVAPPPGLEAPRVHAFRTYLWRAMDLITVFFLSRFTRHPLRLFGAVGSAFAAVGGALLLVLGTQRLLGTPLADRPLLVLAVLLVGLGVQAFTIGLLGELVLFFHARNLRDYRISAVYESGTPALPEAGAGSGGELREGGREEHGRPGR